jgi:hypothetical protein
MITIKPKTFTDWLNTCKSYRYRTFELHFGTGGKKMYQCLDDTDYNRGLWNYTDNTGYLYAPEQEVTT